MPITAKIYNQKADTVGEQELSDKVFGLKVNSALVHQAMVAQVSNQRQVLAHTKTKADVRGGGKKPWRQKGTGRARAGSTRSPIWIGGGVVFGPTKERNFKKDINKKMKQKALLMVLSDRVVSGNFVIADTVAMNEFKTRAFNELIKNFENKVFAGKEEVKKPAKTKRSILIINDSKDPKTSISARNLEGIKMINIENINIVDLLKYKHLILTTGTVKALEEKYGTEGKK